MISDKESLKRRLGLEGLNGFQSLQIEFMDIWCEGNNIVNAFVTVSKENIEIDVETDGVTTTLAYPHRFALSNYSSLSDLVSDIESYNGWTVLTYVKSTASPQSLSIQSRTDCLGYQNRIAIQGQEDYALGSLLERATSFIENQCNRIFEATSLEETYDGDGTDTLHLRNYPVSSISKIENYNDGSWGKVDSSDYRLDSTSGRVLKKSGLWSDGFNNYKVNYTAGFDPVPESLKDLVLEVAASMWYKEGGNPRVVSEKIGSYQTEYIEAALPSEIRDRISYWEKKDY